MPWFNENGYKIALPTHPKLELWYQNSQNLPENTREEFKEIFINQIYDEHAFDLSLAKLKKSQFAVNEGLKKLSVLAKNWDFDLKERYTIVLTLYGPRGNYDPSTATVNLLTNEKGDFRKKHVEEIILHEIVHIGIEESIVKRYQLTHWEKERLVDLICYHYLNQILPEYRMHPKGDKQIDDFTNEYTMIHDLPAAIASFIKQHPR